MAKYINIYKSTLALFLFIALLLPISANADFKIDNKAVIFLYQNIGDNSLPRSNISIEKFKEHISELKTGGYSVLPIEQIIDNIKTGKKLPKKTIGITIEGAYKSTIKNALPILKKAHMPFTLFFVSDMIDSKSPSRITWQELNKLKKDPLITLGILPSSYKYMAKQSPKENAKILNKAVSRYREEIKETPEFFSYPYGEYSNDIKKQVSKYNFKASFGQQSGVIYKDSDFSSLPRFIMTNEYGDIDRFTLTANALPLPVNDVIPNDNLILKNPPLIGFSLTNEINNNSKISCFASNIGKLKLSKLSDNRIEIRPQLEFLDRRNRINCTMRTKLKDTAKLTWRWFSMMLINPLVEEDLK